MSQARHYHHGRKLTLAACRDLIAARELPFTIQPVEDPRWETAHKVIWIARKREMIFPATAQAYEFLLGWAEGRDEAPPEGSLAARLESIEGKLTILANHALGLEEEPAPCKHRQVRIMPAKDPSYAIVLAGDVWPATIGKVITLHSNCIWAPADGNHVTVAWEAVLDACADPSSAARVTALWQAQSEAPI